MDYDDAIRYEDYWYNVNAKKYAELVNSNNVWTWEESVLGNSIVNRQGRVDFQKCVG